MAKSSVKPHEVLKWNKEKLTPTPDILAVEEPLEIRLNYIHNTERIERPLAVTMRTPGNDLELVLGFLFTEGIIENYASIHSINHCKTVNKEEEKQNIVKVLLTDNAPVDNATFQRNFYTTSSCGVCGKSSIEAIEVSCITINSSLRVSSKLIAQLPETLRKSQAIFEHTGGLHAAALFNKNGRLELLREDVGRHNALDKVIGACLYKDATVFKNSILLVSGRASFELVQKAAKAGIPILLAVGAPSSLAVELGKKMGITIVGFLKSKSFNIYTHPSKIIA